MSSMESEKEEVEIKSEDYIQHNESYIETVQNHSPPEVISPPPNHLFDQDDVYINFENDVLQNEDSTSLSGLSTHSPKLKGKNVGDLCFEPSQNFEMLDSQNLFFPDNFWGCF